MRAVDLKGWQPVCVLRLMLFHKNLILQCAPLTKTGDARLREHFRVVSRVDLQDFREQVSGVVTTGGVQVDASLIDRLPSLKVVVTRGVGFDHLDIEALKRRGISVSNTPGVLSDCVADLAFGALIAVSRQIVNADCFVRQGGWLQGKYPLTHRVTGKRFGIIGMGRIGRAVLQRARGFNMDVRYHSRACKDDCDVTYESSLENLAHWADYLVVCAPGGSETRNLVSVDVLAALGPDGFLVNIARGSLVDESALISALTHKTIAGAALDVFVDEPQVPQELIALENVVLLPHIGSGTRETFTAMEDLMIENLKSFFSRGTLLTPVEKGS